MDFNINSNSSEEDDLKEGGEVRGYDNNLGQWCKETQKRVLDRLIGFHDSLQVLAWAENEERRSYKMPVTQTEHAGGAGLVWEVLIHSV